MTQASLFDDEPKEKPKAKTTKAKVKKARDRHSIPPTVEEVAEYCAERGNGIDAQNFINRYDAVGWVYGKNTPIKDWQAAVRYWESLNGKFNAGKNNGSSNGLARWISEKSSSVAK